MAGHGLRRSIPDVYERLEALENGGGGGGDAPTGADVVLTGYTAEDAGEVSATDTANAAIAKLEARIAALETAAG